MSWLARKLRRFTVSGSATIIVWRSTGGTQCPLSSGVTVRKVTLTDLYDARSMEDDATIEYLRSQMGKGYHAWFAYCDGIVVHRSLLLAGPARYNLWNWTATLQVPEKEGVIFGCATHPDYRGRGIHPYVLSLIANDSTWRAVWSFTDVDNTASNRGFAKAGFHQHYRLLVRSWHGFARVQRIEV
jgi:ribosomal protein S18 acetylase RimI-like enzyme